MTDHGPLNQLSYNVIGAAIHVHRILGPGLLESAYEACLAYEFDKRGISYSRQKAIPVIYDCLKLECGYRADFIIENKILLELKAKDKITALDQAQLLSYLRLLNISLGLLINFHVLKLTDGITRVLDDYMSPQVTDGRLHD